MEHLLTKEGGDQIFTWNIRRQRNGNYIPQHLDVLYLVFFPSRLQSFHFYILHLSVLLLPRTTPSPLFHLVFPNTSYLLPPIFLSFLISLTFLSVCMFPSLQPSVAPPMVQGSNPCPPPTLPPWYPFYVSRWSLKMSQKNWCILLGAQQAEIDGWRNSPNHLREERRPRKEEGRASSSSSTCMDK